jgi:tripartite-type tricarboxylate transporter receptor subunit TctC
VVIENTAGAGGLIGAMSVAKASPDGHTVLIAATPFTVSPSMQATAPYDPTRDFVPVSRIAILPMVLVTSPDAPYSTLRQFVDHVRANPGRLSYATSGKGVPAHLEMEQLKRTYKLDIQDVPYKAIGNALGDTMSGRVALFLPTFASALPNIKAGKLKALAIGSPTRSSEAPDLPTVAEDLGVPGYEVTVWYGMVAPAGTPPEAIATLNRALARALDAPEVRERIAKTGAVPAATTPAEFGELVRAETQKWGRLVGELKLTSSQ